MHILVYHCESYSDAAAVNRVLAWADARCSDVEPFYTVAGHADRVGMSAEILYRQGRNFQFAVHPDPLDLDDNRPNMAILFSGRDCEACLVLDVLCRGRDIQTFRSARRPH